MAQVIWVTFEDGTAKADLIWRCKKSEESALANARHRDFSIARGVKKAKADHITDDNYLNLSKRTDLCIKWTDFEIKGVQICISNGYDREWRTGDLYRVQVSELGTLCNGFGAAITLDGNILSFGVDGWLRKDVWYFYPDPGELERIGFNGPRIDRTLENIYKRGLYFL